MGDVRGPVAPATAVAIPIKVAQDKKFTVPQDYVVHFPHIMRVEGVLRVEGLLKVGH